MKIIRIQWAPDNPEAIALRETPPIRTLPDSEFNREGGGKPAHRIVITQTGIVVRECVRVF